MFSRVEPFPCRSLHAEAETRPDASGADRVREDPATACTPQRAVICFGPDHAPPEQRHVALALEEAHNLVPNPRIIGQPDVQSENIAEGAHAGTFRVSVHGFDYFNTKTGNVESGDADNVATWMLDPDYNGRSLFPRQVFFPMAGTKDGRTKLARHLKAEIDPDLIEAYRGTVSLPFKPGEHERVAVKIVDDRGVESLKVIQLTQPERG